MFIFYPFNHEIIGGGWSYGSLNLQLHVQSVPITTNIVSSNLVRGEMYMIQNILQIFQRWKRPISTSSICWIKNLLRKSIYRKCLVFGRMNFNDWLIYYGAGLEYFMQSIVIGNLSSIGIFFQLIRSLTTVLVAK
jgi:hypothetical protein